MPISDRAGGGGAKRGRRGARPRRFPPARKRRFRAKQWKWRKARRRPIRRRWRWRGARPTPRSACNAPWRDAGERGARSWRALAAGRSRAGARHLSAGRTGGAAPQSLADHAAWARTAKSWTADTIWDAPADPAVPGRSFYAAGGRQRSGAGRARHRHRSRRARRRPARMIPAAALVLGESEAWVYVQTEPEHLPAHQGRYRPGRWVTAISSPAAASPGQTRS